MCARCTRPLSADGGPRAVITGAGGAMARAGESRKTSSVRRKRSVVGGASMGYQFGQTRDRVLGRRGILGFPIRLEILDTKELEPARRYLLLSREQCSELDIARMHFDLQNRLLANLQFSKPKVLYRKRNGIIIRIGIAECCEEFGGAGQHPPTFRGSQHIQVLH